MEADAIVYWAVTGVVGGAAGVALVIASWQIKSHLALVREVDQFKGEVRSTYVTGPAVREAVASAIKPLERDVERLIDQSRQVGDMLRELAAERHISISAATRG